MVPSPVEIKNSKSHKSLCGLRFNILFAFFISKGKKSSFFSPKLQRHEEIYCFTFYHLAPCPTALGVFLEFCFYRGTLDHNL